MPPRATPPLPADRTPVPIDAVREYLIAGLAGEPSGFGRVVDRLRDRTPAMRAAHGSALAERVQVKQNARFDESRAACACVEALRETTWTWTGVRCPALRTIARRSDRRIGELAVILLSKHDHRGVVRRAFALGDVWRHAAQLGFRLPPPSGRARHRLEQQVLPHPAFVGHVLEGGGRTVRIVLDMTDEAEELLDMWVFAWNS